MKQVRFRDHAGSVRTGEVTKQTITAGERTFEMDDVDVLSPTTPTKVLGIGRNYQNRYANNKQDIPETPRLWIKGGPSVVSNHGATVTLPPSDEIVYEAELGVVIGEQCKAVSEDSALDFVAGYTCVNDLTNIGASDLPGFFRMKSFDNAAPMGPVMATPDHVSLNPRIRLWINGTKQQDTSGDQFIFGIPQVISAFSKITTLEPGDVIMMGNPGGFETLSDGDHVTIEIDGIGTLEHAVRIPST